MEAVSEKWEVTIHKKKFIVTRGEVDFILANENSRFIKLKDLVVNPAFIEAIVLVERRNPNQLTNGNDKPLSLEQREKNHKKILEIKGKYDERFAMS